MRLESPHEMDELVDVIKRGSKRIRAVPTGVTDLGSLPRKPRAVLFDVYGTLLIRIGDLHPRHAAQQRGVEAITRRHRLPTTASKLMADLQSLISQRHAAQRALGKENPEVSIESIWAGLFPDRPPDELRGMIVEYELATHPAWQMPGCLSLLRALARRETVLGIISNAQFYTPLFLHALLGVDLEDLGFGSPLCLYSCDFGIAKPEEALFNLARQRLREAGLRPEEVLMAGNDQQNDVEPAAKAGFMTVLAALDGRSYAPARGSPGLPRPDAVIRRLRSLVALIDAADG
ncbi:MAG: HAD family hydrolase [Spirochaetia bacterium]